MCPRSFCQARLNSTGQKVAFMPVSLLEHPVAKVSLAYHYSEAFGFVTETHSCAQDSARFGYTKAGMTATDPAAAMDEAEIGGDVATEKGKPEPGGGQKGFNGFFGVRVLVQR